MHAVQTTPAATTTHQFAGLDESMESIASIADAYARRTDEKYKHIGLNDCTWMARTVMLRYVWFIRQTNRFTGHQTTTPAAYVVDEYGDLVKVNYIHATVADLGRNSQH